MLALKLECFELTDFLFRQLFLCDKLSPDGGAYPLPKQAYAQRWKNFWPLLWYIYAYLKQDPGCEFLK